MSILDIANSRIANKSNGSQRKEAFRMPHGKIRRNYGETYGYVAVIPKRTGPGYKLITAKKDEYNTIDDFFAAQWRRYRMPARQLARLPLVGEIQWNNKTERYYAIMFHPHYPWRMFKGKIQNELELGHDVVWLSREF